MVRTLIKILIMIVVLIVSRLLAGAGAVEHVLRIDDFEDGDLRAPNSLSWIMLNDDLIGGESTARLEIVTGDEAESKGALRLTGRRSGKVRSFLGAWIAVDGSARPVNLEAFEGIRLRVKSTAPLLAGFRVANINFMAPIEPSAHWRLFQIPFEKLAPMGKVPEGSKFSADAVTWFGVQTAMIPSGAEVSASDVMFEIDDVEIYGGAEASAEPVAAAGPIPVSVLPMAPLTSIPSDGWVELATDPQGDATAALLPDVTRLEERPAGADGMMWFRMTLAEPPQGQWMGVNLALDVDGDPNNGQPWWGSNKEFRFDRLVTAYCFPVANGCQGMFGVADADKAAAGGALEGGDALRVAIDRGHRAFILGVPRAALHLGPGKNRLVAAVGSALSFGDDVPNTGAVLVR